MSIFDIFKTKKTNDTELLANGTVNDYKDVEDPTAKFSSTRFTKTIYESNLKRNVTFQKPEYDLLTIANAIEMDGLLQRSVSIFVEQILKSGYEFVSKDDSIQEHIDIRIREIESLTGIKFYETVCKIARQLVSYGNAYLIKVRSPSKSKYGSPYRLYGKNMNPIVGLFVADASTIEVGLNNSGNVVNYKQRIRGEEIIWDERDVVHFAYNKIPGTLIGMSSIVPILDDLRALRKLEEEIEILGFQYSIPLYLYKVGNKDMPPAPGEIESVSSTVNNMPAYGMLVVPGHHTIEVPTNNNTPVDIIAFCNHFKNRMYAGLGVSPIAMGETNCYDESTLTLTSTGWKSYKDIDIATDKIATYNINNKSLEYHTPNYEYKKYYKGDMIHFLGKHVDIKVTPNHEMWIMIRHSGERKKVFAYELLNGKYPEFCFIDSITNTYGINYLPDTFILDKKTISRDNILKLLGWYLSEGSLDKFNASIGRYRTIISQKKEPFVSEIRTLLKLSNLSFSEQIHKQSGVTNFKIYGKEFYHFMLENGGRHSNKKFISNRFKSSNSYNAKLIVDTMMKGDGWWENDNTGIYYTTSENLRDDFSQLAFEAGYEVKIIQKTYTSKSDIKSNYPIFRIHITQSKKDYRILTVKHVKKVDYNGIVYCYNVPNHLFITMRNGKIAIQGNTSNRNTSETQDLAMQTITMSYQQIIKHRIEIDLIQELLMDGGFNYMDHKMEFNFEQIDIENQIKTETHIMQKFMNNIISHEEARHEMNYDQQFDETGLYMNKIAIPSAKAQADAKLQARAKEVDNKNRPANQHGKKASRPKIVKNFMENSKYYNINLSDNLCYDFNVVNRTKYSKKLLSSLVDSITQQLNYNIKQYSVYYNIDNITYNYEYVDSYIKSLNDVISDKIERFSKNINDNTTEYFINGINTLIDEQFNRVDSLAKILIYKSLGYKTILLDTKECELHSNLIINLDDITYNNIPPFKYGCNCKIDEKGTNEFKKENTSEDNC